MKKLTIFLLLLMSICLPLKISANVDVTIDVDRDVEGKTYTDLVNYPRLKHLGFLLHRQALTTHIQ